jgi:hypothetical protein
MLSQAQYNTYHKEVLEVIDKLKDEKLEKDALEKIVLEMYGPDAKDILKEELDGYKVAAQEEEKQPESAEEEPKLDPEVQKVIKYFARRLVRLDKADLLKVFGVTITYFLARKPKLLAGLVKKFKRLGLE